MDSPFDLDNDRVYARWREIKLSQFSDDIDAMLVNIKDVNNPDSSEINRLTDVIRRHNMVIYNLTSGQVDKSSVRQFAAIFGLNHIDSNLCSDEDSITSLTVAKDGQQSTYIPYSNRRLSWHTDGYYNPLDRQVRGVVLHCVSPAAEGGENLLLDHELAYIQLRDKNPDYIRALMAPDVMLIPPNTEGGEEIRGSQTGPVFSLENDTGNLHMRYTARTRNIVWKDDEITRQATRYLTEILSDSPYILKYRLKAGQGLICNNVLHNRSGFVDDEQHKRLIYRARYYDRVSGTDISTALEGV